ncbi:YDG/SRA domain-containing protein [Streptomyces sp. NPDC052701]|uniref:YDG/SRA domain-containing protein n=1 Tax=Streptomyces sp. NPDC052701 TaxID=3155533 RepID=UPI003448EFA9
MIDSIQDGCMRERKIGHIAGIAPGAEFHRRRHVKRNHLHGDTVRGISTLKDKDGVEVADAIVLHGGYEDDHDDWDWVRYTGASPDADKYKENGVPKLRRSQSWEYPDNAALKRSYERNIPIRVIRGWKGDARYSPIDCYRYDGLYEITDIRTALSKSSTVDGAPIEICQFDLHRLPDSLQDPTSVERHISDLLEQPEGTAPGTSEGVEDETEESEQEESPLDEKFPETRTTQVQRLVRDDGVIRNVKRLYDGECQLCGLRLEGPDGKPHSEGAHIRPLGKPHKGPDVEPNVLCLCPNCHVRLDIGAVVIDDDWSIIVRTGTFSETLRPKLKRVRAHKVHLDYIRYHREWWLKKAKQSEK